MSRSKKNNPNQLRIIAGEWRGRKLQFPDHQGLRPTTDRVRETVFNWLQGRLPGARVLDLFAGSGALGLEAASRGAGEVILVDTYLPAIESIREHCQRLDANNIKAYHVDALEYLDKSNSPFDLIFLDPPFDTDLQQALLPQLLHPKMLKEKAVVYVEAPKSAELALPASFEWFRRRVAGDVQYGLIANN